MGNMYNSKRYIYDLIEVDLKHTIDSSDNEALVESTFTLDKNQHGGMIIFSTDVNCDASKNSSFISRLKQFIDTIKNKLTKTSKINSIAKKYDLTGWTIGKYFRGHYQNNKTGEDYSENSICVELIGIDSDTLLSVAQDILTTFNQQSVLVKDYNNHDILFVNND